MKSVIIVFLIEDNPGDAILIREMLRDSEDVFFQVVHADTLSSGLDMLKQEEVDVVLLDLTLPDSQGIETFFTLQLHNTRLPVVILTGLDDKDVAVKAMHQGAQDYLIKGRVDTDLLTRSLQYAIERKFAEEELRKSEENYRNIITNNADAMMIINEYGIIQYMNPAAEDLFGQASRTMVGSKFEYPLTLNNPTEIEILHPDNTRAIAGMKTVETVWEGEDVFLVVLRDITEAMIAQKALENQTYNLGERIKELQCIYSIGELTRKEDISIEATLQEITRLIPHGWQVPARTGCRITYGEKIFTENFTETSSIQKAYIKGTEKMGTIEISYHATEEEKEQNGFNSFLTEEQELLNAIADRVAEFIERMKAKKILEESEKKYRTLFDNSSDAIFIHALDGKILEINRVAIDRLGYSREEFLTFTPQDIDTPQFAAMIPERLEMVIQEGQYLFETIHVGKDGHAIPTEISSRLIDFNGK
ncbi:MAG: PAS domain S-box protein, partial [Theionarchaea archaeon]|nr:PAS domain S-box protein [Theionarchaea archaeon]